MSGFYTNVDMNFNDILVRGYDDKGNHFSRKEYFRPTLYIPSNTPTDFKSLDGNYLNPYNPGTIKETRDFQKRYANVDNFKFYGMEKPIYNYIAENYPGEINYDFTKIKIGYIDIETECESGFPDIETANEEILLITLFFKGSYYIFSTNKWGIYKSSKENVKSIVCSTEKELLEKFIEFWCKINLDVISGWYSEGFDIIYMINRMANVIGMEKTKKLSPWGILKKKEVFVKGKNVQMYDIIGINHLDYKDLDAKFSGKVRENGKLDTVAHEELKMRKLDYSEYGSLHELYHSNWTLFCDYNIRDVEILPLLEDKMKLIELVCSITYYSGTNMIDSFKNTRVWDQIIYRHLLSQNIIIPQRASGGDTDPFPGGFVKEPLVGLHDWVINFDLNSLYPSLIMQYNISPETELGRRDIDISKLVKGDDSEIKDLKEQNYSVAANGVYFTKEFRGFLPLLMDNLYKERSSNKDNQILSEKRAQKIREEILRRKS